MIHQDLWDSAVAELYNGNRKIALDAFIALVNEGCKAAYREVANIYETPSHDGVTQDYGLAGEWYLKAIEEANDAFGCLELATLYYYGLGRDIKYEKAYEYLSMVDDKKIPEVHLMLGRIFHFGRGLDRDAEKARRHYQIAIDQGNLIALRNMSSLEIEEGRYFLGLKMKIQAAIKIFTTALKNPHDFKLRDA